MKELLIIAPYKKEGNVLKSSKTEINLDDLTKVSNGIEASMILADIGDIWRLNFRDGLNTLSEIELTVSKTSINAPPNPPPLFNEKCQPVFVADDKKLKELKFADIIPQKIVALPTNLKQSYMNDLGYHLVHGKIVKNPEPVFIFPEISKALLNLFNFSLTE